MVNRSCKRLKGFCNGPARNMETSNMPAIYLITEATADVCVAIICAIGCEAKALGREHGENAQIETMHGGWTVRSGEARIAYRVHDESDGRAHMEVLLASGRDVHVRLDYFLLDENPVHTF